MASDKTVRLILKPPTLPELEVPEEIAGDPTLELLYGILTRLQILEDHVNRIYIDVEDYLYVEDSVTDTSSKDIDIVKTLGRISKSGFIRNDGSADIYIEVNGGDKIKLGKSEQLKWGGDANRLIVRRIVISTESSTAQSYRLLAI